MTPMLDVDGFILVGGRSSRMGKDKSRLMFGDLSSVGLIAASLQTVTTTVKTVGPPVSTFEGLANIADTRDKWGPLAGIEAALSNSKSEHCLIVACDLPFVTAELFAKLIKLADRGEAIVPLQGDGRPQPLCALYRRSPCLAAAQRSIAVQEHSPRALLDQVDARFVPFTELSDLKGSEYFFFNVNTPENYAQARVIFSVVKRSGF
ncbi:MAG: molybdenum cofactor guanylyltransferase [Pyrinomonadaceae bacterium]